MFCDMLWSDPQVEHDGFDDNINRGCSYRYGKRVIKKFLKENNLKTIIRAHEV